MIDNTAEWELEREANVFMALVTALAALIDADVVTCDSTGVHIEWLQTDMLVSEISQVTEVTN